MTNSSQTVTGTLTQDGFGNTVATTGSSSNPYMYAATSGYRNDGDAGLSHVGARYYDAQVERFISRDTFLDQKPYLYCEHDPVNNLDPTGHELTPKKYFDYMEQVADWEMKFGGGGWTIGSGGNWISDQLKRGRGMGGKWVGPIRTISFGIFAGGVISKVIAKLGQFIISL